MLDLKAIKDRLAVVWVNTASSTILIQVHAWTSTASEWKLICSQHRTEDSNNLNKDHAFEYRKSKLFAGKYQDQNFSNTWISNQIKWTYIWKIWKSLLLHVFRLITEVNGGSSAGIENRIVLAIQRRNATYKRKISRKTRKRITGRLLVFFIFLYLAETWDRRKLTEQIYVFKI